MKRLKKLFLLTIFLIMTLSASASRADIVIPLPPILDGPQVIGYWQWYDAACCCVHVTRLYSDWTWESEDIGGPCPSE